MIYSEELGEEGGEMIVGEGEMEGTSEWDVKWINKLNYIKLNFKQTRLK